MAVTYREVGESAQNASVRPLVTIIDREMSRLAGGSPMAGMGVLLESWGKLLELLALGPEPEMRECPVCKHGGMRAATRCGFCWTPLPPLGRGGDQPAAGLDGG